YDEANRVSHEYKEKVKVGYNLRRKVILLSLWAVATGIVLVKPTLLGLEAKAGLTGMLENVSLVWLAIGVGAVLSRTARLIAFTDVPTGLVWLTKILTAPFHDVMLYHKAPYHVLRGQLFDPIVPEQEPQQAKA